MKIFWRTMLASTLCALSSAPAFAQAPRLATVKVENISPVDGVALTPVWVGFHSGSFDSYNGGLRALAGLERVAEDGDNSLISEQFLDFDSQLGGYTYIDNSGSRARSALVRTGDLTDRFRQDASLGNAPLLPGESASQQFVLGADGSNDFFSYAAMVLPTNDFFVANASPVAHDISSILESGGEIEFFIGTPNGSVNDAGTEREDFATSAGNGLFPGRNLPAGQAGPNQGRTVRRPISSVTGNPFQRFRLISRRDAFRLRSAQRYVSNLVPVLERFERWFGVDFSDTIAELQAWVANLEATLKIDVSGLNFNEYSNGIARVTISVEAVEDDGEDDGEMDGEDDETGEVSARFTLSVRNVDGMSEVSFNNRSENADTFEWSFPGALPETSTLENPVVTYLDSGTFTITLVASNGDSSDTVTQTITINGMDEEDDVDDEPAGDLRASFSVRISRVNGLFQVTMVNRSTNATDFDWSFPRANPETSTEENPVVTYSEGGSFSITLVASNGDESDTRTVNISL